MMFGNIHGNKTKRYWYAALVIGVFLLACTCAYADEVLPSPEIVKISDGGFGDPQNNYAWSVAEFNGDLYVGTGRNIPYFVAQAMKARGTFPANWTLSFLTTPSGSPPPPLVLPNHTPPSQVDVIAWSDDMRAEIWRYHEDSWSRVHQATTFVNPLNGYTYPEGIGYRAMTTFTDREGTEGIYAGVGFGFGPILVVRSTDGDTWVPVNTSSIPSRDTRAMISHNGRLYVGTGEGVYATDLPSPSEDSWVKVADFQTASLASFDGYLYAGTGNPIGPSETNGFEVWRSTTESPESPDDWEKVVSGGAGDAWNVLAATMREYDGDLYVGSMNLPFGTGTDGVKGFDLIRVDTQDSWELIVGNYHPKIPTDPRGPPISGWPSGYANPFNLYAWSIEEYDGNLYVGSFDIFSLARFIDEIPGGYEILEAALASVEVGEESGEFSDELERLRDMGLEHMDESQIIPLIKLCAIHFGGADLWRSADGVHWVPVNLNGLGDPNNYGLRTMEETGAGMIIGTANPFTGCQVWVASCPVPEPPVADFFAIPRSGDAPLSVIFADQSSGSRLSYYWDFGDGSISTEKNNVHKYLSPGSYNVTLTVTNAAGSSTECKESYIEVTMDEPLVANFSSNVTSGTLPLMAQFTDASQGAHCSWFWVFQKDSYYPIRDAVTQQAIPYYGNEFSAEKNPVVIYTYPGNYSVSLTVSRSNETDSITKEDYIHVDPPAPVADFNAYPREGDAPLSVEFWENVPYFWYYDEFLWEFGDGNTGSGSWIYHTYDSPGHYNVTLTVTSAYGNSSKTEEGFITVTQSLPPTPDFEATPLAGNAPLNVAFTDTSTGLVTSRWWDFGDGTTVWSNESTDIEHTYPFPGTYTVSLTAGNAAGQETMTKPGLIQVSPSGAPPTAFFSLKPMSGIAPMTVAFTDRSRGTPLAWQWDFGDGSTSTEQNPVRTYTGTGTYTVTLKVLNYGGSSSHSSFVWVRSGTNVFTTIPPSPTVTSPPNITARPTIPPRPGLSPISFFKMNPSFGFAPMSVQFTEMSFNAPTSWEWDFGDGHTSTLQNPVNTFTAPGTYPVSLTVKNAIGESTTSRSVYVR
jgi:PKD repeat protein